jgi:V8-like Glu-specific endopeptidase
MLLDFDRSMLFTLVLRTMNMTRENVRSSKKNNRSTTHHHLRLEGLEGRKLMAAEVLDSALTEGHHVSLPAMIASATPGTTNSRPVEFIVNGQQTSDYKAVGVVNGGCTGTLISPTHVLTAAHCVENDRGGYIGNTQGTFLVNGQTYRTVKITPHPKYNPNNFGAGYDLAIMELDRPVVGVAPYEINRLAPRVGQMLTLVGFGEAGTSSNPSHGFGVKNVGTTPIDSITNEHISWTIDSSNEASTAPGDSGGPAFINVGSKLLVAGVTSGGSEDAHSIGSTSFDTRIDTLASWIDSVVGAVSSGPVVSIKALDAAAAETKAGLPVNTGTYQISRTGPTSAPLTVNVTLSGTATNGVDYTRIPTTVTIPAGANSTVVTVTPTDDSLVEPSERVVLTLSAQSGYRVDNTLPSATVTIADNDVRTSNDLFANRTQLSGAVANATGSNVGATREAGETNIEGVSGGKSVWWSWTAPASGRVTLSTAGSAFDTTLGVYTGSSVNALRRVVTNDDNPAASDYSSLVQFNAVAGQTYQIAVDGYEGATGSIKLSLNQTQSRLSANSQSTSVTNSRFDRTARLTHSNRDDVFERLGRYSDSRAVRASIDHHGSSPGNFGNSFEEDDSDELPDDSVVDSCLLDWLDDDILNHRAPGYSTFAS